MKHQFFLHIYVFYKSHRCFLVECFVSVTEYIAEVAEVAEAVAIFFVYIVVSADAADAVDAAVDTVGRLVADGADTAGMRVSVAVAAVDRV
jgi:hypothetical protein